MYTVIMAISQGISCQSTFSYQNLCIHNKYVYTVWNKTYEWGYETNFDEVIPGHFSIYANISVSMSKALY